MARMPLTRRFLSSSWAWALLGLALCHTTGTGAQFSGGCTRNLAQGPFGTADPWTPVFDDKHASQHGRWPMNYLYYSTAADRVRSLRVVYNGASTSPHHGASESLSSYLYMIPGEHITQAIVYTHPSTGRLVGLDLTTTLRQRALTGDNRTGVPRTATPCPSTEAGRPLRLAYLRGQAGASGVQSLFLVWAPYSPPSPPPSPPPPPPVPPEPMEIAPPELFIQRG